MDGAVYATPALYRVAYRALRALPLRGRTRLVPHLQYRSYLGTAIHVEVAAMGRYAMVESYCAVEGAWMNEFERNAFDKTIKELVDKQLSHILTSNAVEDSNESSDDTLKQVYRGFKIACAFVLVAILIFNAFFFWLIFF